MRAISDDAVNASKSARRQRERRPQVIQGGRSDSTLAGSPPMPPTAAIRTDDPDTEPKEKLQPWQRMLPVEEWS
jgi:putative transposase